MHTKLSSFTMLTDACPIYNFMNLQEKEKLVLDNISFELNKVKKDEEITYMRVLILVHSPTGYWQ